MTGNGWLARIDCTRAEADALSVIDDPLEGVEPVPTLVATEGPGGWALHLYCEDAPGDDLLALLAGLAPALGAVPQVEPLPDADWLTLSQAGLEPVNAGRFHVHTSDHRGEALAGQWPIVIDAGLAFGTGQHDTTAGCLMALQRIAKLARPHAVLDVGTGTGLLIFAARRLFPRARLMASDIDRRAVRVAVRNAKVNGIAPGRIAMRTAFGVAHRDIADGGPWPLVTANILAGPLAAMAPSLGGMVARGGYLVLAGLLDSQRRWLVARYQAMGFRLVHAGHGAEWPVLVLRKRTAGVPKAALRRARKGTAAAARRADSI